ncbi:MAG TPA: 3-isopropylmalate dehydratase large subunit [Clostridia bacterium]|nr:3-isopropylmalate dehydratase large subunit [Clostridia bacterium]
MSTTKRPMTITEKILAAHAKRESVEPGEIILARVDLTLANDITGPIAIKQFEELGAGEVFDRSKVALVPDHFVPNKDISSAEQAKRLREFASKHGIVHYYEVGRMGVEHALLPELGIISPGDLVIGADSHTCTYGALGAFATGVGSTDLACAWATGEVWLKVPETILFRYHGRPRRWVSGKDLILYTIGDIGVDGATYKAMEFAGDALSYLDMDSRFTMANMAIEAGGKNGIFAPDQIVFEYVRSRKKASGAERAKAGEGPGKNGRGGAWAVSKAALQSDPGACYCEVRDYDVAQIDLQVSFPHSPGNARPISDVGDVKIDQVVIGSCTNGRLEDLRVAAKILKGHRVHPEVRLIIIPATQEVYMRALQEGLIEVFLEAEAAVSTPTCGPCLGGYMGILAAGERAVATTNRNFLGRMGHPSSEVYLAGPAVAAASAVKGRIAHPDEVVGTTEREVFSMYVQSTDGTACETDSARTARDDDNARGGSDTGHHDGGVRTTEAVRGVGDGARAGADNGSGKSDGTSGDTGNNATDGAISGRGAMAFTTGRAWKFGANIDTDVIIPAKYLNTSDPEELSRHAFEDLRPEFRLEVKAGDIIVADTNFGCGSSREHAPLAIKASGVSCVIAASFARIFYRNALNIGLPILECPEASGGIKDGDVVSANPAEGTVENVTRGLKWRAKPLPPFIQEMIAQGGLVPYTKNRIGRKAI